MSIIRSKGLTYLAGVALMAAACGDDSEGGSGGLNPDSVEPQVRTESPLCLNQRPFPVVGDDNSYGTIITNFGEEALLVRSAEIVEERRDGALEITGLVGPEGEACSPQSPCRIGFREDVIMRVELTPPSAGWDRALVRLDTNDPNFTDGFSFAVVAASESAPGAEDFGDRPDELRCTCRTPLPEECQ